MTNTTQPMTFDEWLKTDEGVVKFGMNLSDDYKQFAWDGWQEKISRKLCNPRIGS